MADGKTPTSGSPIDGNWQAKGTVVVARHIQDVKAGDRSSRTWSIKTTCAGKPKKCATVLSYHIGAGKQIRLRLHGANANWSGTLTNQTFDCTNGGTAKGSISFKLHVDGFTKHLKRRVARSITARGVQSGTGCAVVKEVVSFKVSRLGF